MTAAPPAPAVKLTRRQREVLEMLANHAHAIIWRKTDHKLLTVHAGTAKVLIRLGYVKMTKMAVDDYLTITDAGKAALESLEA